MLRLTSILNTNHAKNVIIFVGDGMGIQTGTMARIYKGQKMGKSGEESVLEWEKFPTTGLSKVRRRTKTSRYFYKLILYKNSPRSKVKIWTLTTYDPTASISSVLTAEKNVFF